MSSAVRTVPARFLASSSRFLTASSRGANDFKANNRLVHTGMESGSVCGVAFSHGGYRHAGLFFCFFLHTGREDSSSASVSSKRTAFSLAAPKEEEEVAAGPLQGEPSSTFLPNSFYALSDRRKEREFFHDFKYTITRPDLRNVMLTVTRSWSYPCGSDV